MEPVGEGDVGRSFWQEGGQKKAPGATPWMLWVSLKLWKKFPGNGSLLSFGGCFQLLIDAADGVAVAGGSVGGNMDAHHFSLAVQQGTAAGPGGGEGVCEDIVEIRAVVRNYDAGIEIILIDILAVQACCQVDHVARFAGLGSHGEGIHGGSVSVCLPL